MKFLEFIEKYQPGKLNSYFDKDYFVYAAVPYTIKSYQEILKNPKDTILFDHEWDTKINKRRNSTGADGALLRDNNDEIYHVNLIEKILATVLAKMSNFIPEAGIWMNTQRPEWNDANNALVGNGVSMVTLYYLRRFLKFFHQLLENSDQESIKISNEMVDFYHAIRENLTAFQPLLSKSITNQDRKKILDALGQAASDYRNQVYNSGFWGKKRTHSMSGLKQFVGVSLEFIEHAIKANQRPDKLYHAYNLMSLENNGVTISYLPEILEALKNSYKVLEIDRKRIMNYSSLYLDTPDFKFYNDHHNGRINRTKIRQRKYVDSNLTFIEIKKKNGKGETDKFRKQIADFETELSQKSKDFIFKITSKNLDLQLSLWNDFKRITLVNLESKERVTIDLNLSFSIDSKQKVYSKLVVIELKQAKFDRTSEVVKLLKSIQCNPYSISKYCVGATNLYQDLKNNLIKPKLLKINKLSL